MITVNSEIFTRILFSPIALKDIFATFKIRNLPVSVNYKVILPFFDGFIFMKLRSMRSFANIKTSQKFPNLHAVLYSNPYHYFFVLKCYMLMYCIIYLKLQSLQFLFFYF